MINVDQEVTDQAAIALGMSITDINPHESSPLPHTFLNDRMAGQEREDSAQHDPT